MKSWKIQIDKITGKVNIGGTEYKDLIGGLYIDSDNVAYTKINGEFVPLKKNKIEKAGLYGTTNRVIIANNYIENANNIEIDKNTD